jgi:four helix bundle protein
MKAWQSSICLLKEVYLLCNKLPLSESFNLISQIKRATLSVSNNIAEGAARKSAIERKRFYEIARSSNVEVDNCLEAIIALQFLVPNNIESAENLVEEIFKLLTAMINNS